jgi:hypothetical protein
METAIDEMEAYRFEPKTRVVHKKDDTYPDVVRYLITQTPVYEPLAAAMAPRRRVNPLERFQAGDVGDMTSAQRDYYTSLLEMGDEDHAESENELYGIGR